MAFDFNGGSKKNSGKTFDPNDDLFSEPGESGGDSGGFGGFGGKSGEGKGGFGGFGGFGSGGDDNGPTELADSFDPNALDDGLSGKPRKTTGGWLSNGEFPWKLLFTVLIIGIPVVLIIANWDIVMEFLMSLLSVVVVFVVLVIVLKILFPRRRR